MDFEEWYDAYTYGSKLLCIKVISESNLSEEEKKIRILSHILRLPKESQKFYRDKFEV